MCIRDSLPHWREVGSPVGEVEARLRLAECLLQDRDTAGAELELHAVESHQAPVTAAHAGRLGSLRDALRVANGLSSGPDDEEPDRHPGGVAAGEARERAPRPRA